MIIIITKHHQLYSMAALREPLKICFGALIYIAVFGFVSEWTSCFQSVHITINFAYISGFLWFCLAFGWITEYMPAPASYLDALSPIALFGLCLAIWTSSFQVAYISGFLCFVGLCKLITECICLEVGSNPLLVAPGSVFNALYALFPIALFGLANWTVSFQSMYIIFNFTDILSFCASFASVF